MRAVARAQPNIALVKYWGKRDTRRNLPAVGSISVTLDELYTRMDVELHRDLEADALTVNGDADTAMLPRVTRCLDRLLGKERPNANIRSECNFPIAAGLASSASAFAALVVAAASAAGLSLDRGALARRAGAASGSAARSLYGGFVELSNRDDDIEVRQLSDAVRWPLSIVVAITASTSKPLSSGEAMEISRKSSPFYANWVKSQPHDLDAARTAIETRDFAELGAVAEHNCLKMHSVMWASRPAIVYWNSATLSCLQTIRRLQADGIPVFFTIDAGPQLKAVCEPRFETDVREALDATDGVITTMTSGLGDGAALLRNS